jgi:dihydropyrimidinase
MDDSGVNYVCSPPPRDDVSWEAIWEGLQGLFDTFSSDHSPFMYEGHEGKLNPRTRISFK